MGKWMWFSLKVLFSRVCVLLGHGSWTVLETPPTLLALLTSLSSSSESLVVVAVVLVEVAVGFNSANSLAAERLDFPLSSEWQVWSC